MRKFGNDLVDAAWPYKTSEICYRQAASNHERFRVLEVFNSQDDGGPAVGITNRTLQELLHHSEDLKPCPLRLVIITQSWIPDGHKKIPQYDVSQEGFTDILDAQGIRGIFTQTRVDVAGVFGRAMCPASEGDLFDTKYFGYSYDSFLGMWARYDRRHKQWRGVWAVRDLDLSLEGLVRTLIDFRHSKGFLCLLAARYTVEFLRVRLGELQTQVAKIEERSGHHDLILCPLPSTYKDLGNISAEATAKANLVSYYGTVVKYVATELLKCLEETCGGTDAGQVKDVGLHVASLRGRIGSFAAYLGYLERRVERQVTATVHLINQANASTNLTVAHDTRELAIASKSDSSSMKILAAVTTTFLPGAFVATLFSMDMFDWFAGRGNPVISDYFWIYWSITIPLTVLTTGSWLGWEFWRAKKQPKQRSAGDIEDPLGNNKVSLSFLISKFIDQPVLPLAKPT